MTYKPPFQSYQENLEKKKMRSPIFLGVLSVLLIGAGITLIWIWINSGGVSSIALFQTKTPTTTITPTSPPPTMTPLNTLVPTETLTPTVTLTSTADAPFEYQVQSNDSLFLIAEKFGVEDIVLIMIINGLTSEDFLTVGQILKIPNPDMIIPTSTQIPADLAEGEFFEYMVLPGDSVRVIAELFFSTVEDIVEANELPDSYLIHPGDILLIPYTAVTPTSSPPPNTSTPTP